MQGLETAAVSGPRILSWIAGEDPRSAHLRTALFFAVLLHLVLALLFPNMPPFKLSMLGNNLVLNVFLKKTEEPKPFEQSLQRPTPLPEIDQPLVDASLGSTSTTTGEEPVVTEDSPQFDSPMSDIIKTNPAGDKAVTTNQPMLIISSAMIKAFAEKEVQREQSTHPEIYERFKRSFNSRLNYQQRNNVQSYANRYGDYYVRASSSSGDICFVQKQDLNPSEFTTNTVFFYDCKAKPKGFDLSSDG